jgi:hypothetical protein
MIIDRGKLEFRIRRESSRNPRNETASKRSRGKGRKRAEPRYRRALTASRVNRCAATRECRHERTVIPSLIELVDRRDPLAIYKGSLFYSIAITYHLPSLSLSLSVSHGQTVVPSIDSEGSIRFRSLPSDGSPFRSPLPSAFELLMVDQERSWLTQLNRGPRVKWIKSTRR